MAVDVGFLSPQACSYYHQRRFADGFVGRISSFFFAVANEFHPENSVPAFEDDVLGLCITVESSADDRVGLEVTLEDDLEADERTFDGLAFETSRAVMVSASQQVRLLTAVGRSHGWEEAGL